MMNERTEIWQQLTGLHEAIAELIQIQRTTVAANPQAEGKTESEIAQISIQLEQLHERLQPLREMAEQPRQERDEAKQHFVEIDVERINVVEADGTIRMALANAHRMADPVVDGEVLGEREGSDGFAGIIFFNAEGDECGGLGYTGQRTEEGYTSAGLLTFDQFKQDQVVWMNHFEENGNRTGGLHVWDRPDMPLPELIASIEAVEKLPDEEARRAAFQQMREEGKLAARRIFVGKTVDKDAVLNLCDAQGRIRARLVVEAEGTAKLEFMDEGGAVVASLPETP